MTSEQGYVGHRGAPAGARGGRRGDRLPEAAAGAVVTRPCNDLATVIEGNVDFALKLLKRRLAHGGVFLETPRLT